MRLDPSLDKYRGETMTLPALIYLLSLLIIYIKRLSLSSTCLFNNGVVTITSSIWLLDAFIFCRCYIHRNDMERVVRFELSFSDLEGQGTTLIPYPLKLAPYSGSEPDSHKSCRFGSLMGLKGIN